MEFFILCAACAYRDEVGTDLGVPVLDQFFWELFAYRTIDIALDMLYNRTPMKKGDCHA